MLANAKPGEIVLMHCGSNPKDHSTLDAAALPTVIRDLKARGYSFVTIDAMLGYRFTLSNGDVRQYGAAGFGTLLGKLPGRGEGGRDRRRHATGGYWVLKSDGGVHGLQRPLERLTGLLPAGIKATAIAAGASGGYYVLTSDGDVHAFGAAGSGSDWVCFRPA